MGIGYDIIIQAGQSNAQGYGYGDISSPYTENENILYYCDVDFEKYDNTKYCSNGDGYEITVARERERDGRKINNFSLSFASEYIRTGMLKEGRRLLIIRCAIGATSFYKKRWGKNDDLFLRMLRAMDNAKKLEYGDNDHRFIAFLWHQGESDSDVNPSSIKYYNDLKYLVESVREKTNKNLPFIAGDFVQDWKNSAPDITKRANIIIDGTRKLCKELTCSAFVESEGLLSNRLNPSCPNFDDVINDNIHFCREAQKELGIRYFEKYVTIFNKKI